MKFITSAAASLAALYAFSSPDGTYADKTKSNLEKTGKQLLNFIRLKAGLGESDSEVTKDDADYWSRFLQDVDMSVTPPPTPPPPTPTPPPPAPPPTTPEECFVEVEVECETADGVPCTDIPPTDGQCSSGEPLTELTLSYIFCECDESDNSQQGGPFSCTDVEPDACEAAEVVRVTCTDDDENGVFSGLVPAGDTFVVDNDGDPLPDSLTCAISTADGGTICQELSFDTSGTVDLFLKDKFGSLTLDGCTDDSGNGGNCFLDIKYTYTISNVGGVEMTITKVERTRNGDTEDLIDLVDPTDLDPMESTVVCEEEELDVCQDVCYETTVEVEADPPAGVPCLDTDDYEFCTSIVTPPPTTPPPTPPSPTTPTPTPPSPTTPPPTPPPPTTPPPTPPEICDVDVEVNCTTVDGGEPCEDITPPPATCSGGECIERLTLSFRDCNCTESDNNQGPEDFQCEDFPDAGIPEGGLALVTCVNADRIYCNCTVREGETITLEGLEGECLPDFLTCTINDAIDGETSQEVTFDTSGEVSLSLKDKFGKLTIEGCEDEDGDISVDCLVDVDYEYTVTNEGDVPITVTVLERTCNGEFADLLDGFPEEERNILPGNSILVADPGTVDSCTASCYNKTVTVETQTPSGVVCEDEDELNFCVPARSPTLAPIPPVGGLCDVTIDAECTPPEGADDCGAIPVFTTICEKRPTLMVMKYNGGTCEQSFNMQIGTALFDCFDFNGGPPTEEGALSYIVATDTKGANIVYYEGFVPVGGEFPLRDGENEVEPNMNVTIYQDDDTSPENIIQTLIYHSSCSANLFLKDIFGSIQLALFENSVQGVVSCFVETTYDFTVTNEGMTDAELRSLVSVTNFGVFNFTDEVLDQPVSGGGGTFTVVENVTIDLTQRQRYTALTTVTAVASGSDEICRDTDFLTFVAGNPAPPGFPTAAPSAFGLPTPPAPIPA